MMIADAGQFLADNFKVIMSVFLFGIGLYLSLVWKHFDTKFKYIKEQYMALSGDHAELTEKLVHLEHCQHEMETNYISRFSDIKQSLAENKEEIIKTIHSVENRIKDDMFRYSKENKE